MLEVLPVPIAIHVSDIGIDQAGIDTLNVWAGRAGVATVSK